MDRRGFFAALIGLPFAVRAALRRESFTVADIRRHVETLKRNEIARPYVGVLHGENFMRDSDPPIQWDDFQRLNSALPDYSELPRFSAVDWPVPGSET